MPPEQQKPIVALMDQILTAKHANPAADLTAFEADLNARVAALYGLTPDEIRLAEESAPSSGSRASPAPDSPPLRRGRAASGGGAGRGACSLADPPLLSPAACVQPSPQPHRTAPGAAHKVLSTSYPRRTPLLGVMRLHSARRRPCH